MSPEREQAIQEGAKAIAMLGGVTVEDAEKSVRILVERLSITPSITLCKAHADGTPDEWGCQLGRDHGGPFHIYADDKMMLKWANGEDGYVPEECPDPSVHGWEF